MSTLNSYGHKRRIHLHRQPRHTKKRGLVEYYSLATCYYENGKNQKKIIYGVGELTKQQADQYRLFLRAINGQVELDKIADLDAVIFEDEKQYLDVLAMNALWESLGLHKAFPSEQSQGQSLTTEQVARILTINRLLCPRSKIKTVSWLAETLLPKILEIDVKSYDRNKVFRELTNIHAAKENLEKLFWSYSQKNRNKYDAYYFDGTTSWFEGSQCSLAEADIEKTRGYFPEILGLMLITDNQGFPVAWEVVSGHTKDTSELKNFIKRISEKYGISEITYCFDRGVASEKNFQFITNTTNKYISAIRDNQIKDVLDLDRFQVARNRITEVVCHNEENSKSSRRIAGIDGFYSLDGNIFFKDLGVIKNRRYVASFNFELYLKEHKAREERIAQTLLELANKNEELCNAKRNRDYNATERDLLSLLSKHQVRNYFSYTLLPIITVHKAQSFKIECQLQKEQIHNDQLTDGLLVYVTNHTEKVGQKFIITASDIVNHYKGKHVVENAFRELKSFIDFRPIYVWTPEHVRAHYDICIAAYFISNYIRVMIQDLDKSLRDFYADLEKAGRVAKLRAPSGLEIYKLKKVQPAIRNYFSKLGITKILSPSLHRAQGVSQ